MSVSQRCTHDSHADSVIHFGWKTCVIEAIIWECCIGARGFHFLTRPVHGTVIRFHLPWDDLFVYDIYKIIVTSNQLLWDTLRNVWIRNAYLKSRRNHKAPKRSFLVAIKIRTMYAEPWLSKYRQKCFLNSEVMQPQLISACGPCGFNFYILPAPCSWWQNGDGKQPVSRGWATNRCWHDENLSSKPFPHEISTNALFRLFTRLHDCDFSKPSGPAYHLTCF